MKCQKCKKEAIGNKDNIMCTYCGYFMFKGNFEIDPKCGSMVFKGDVRIDKNGVETFKYLTNNN